MQAQELHLPTQVRFPRTLPSHVATIQDIDDRIAGRVKAPVERIATTHIAGTYDNITQTLTLGAAGELSIDGGTMAANDRLALTAQMDATQNGIYAVTFAGDVSNPAILTRADDFNESAEILEGVQFQVNAGTLFANTRWRLATTGIIILDTTALTFTKVEETQAAATYATTINADGVATSFNVKHDLGTQDLSVTVRNLTTNALAIVGWDIVDNNNITLQFAIAPDNTMIFRVVVIG